MAVPAHKQTDPNKAPGQVINKIKTLDQYIAVKKTQIAVAEKKKVLFEVWIEQYRASKGLRNGWGEWDTDDMYDSWCAGQENK